MENKATHFVNTVNSERERTYEYFDPYCKWNGRGDMVELHLQGFRKEHLIVRTSNRGIVTIRGERPVNETNSNRWSCFHKEIKLAEDCDPNEVSAQLAGGVLTVTMPWKAAHISTTSSELIRRGFNVGKGVAVKFVVAVALVVTLGFGAYLVKCYKHGHCPPLY